MTTLLTIPKSRKTPKYSYCDFDAFFRSFIDYMQFEEMNAHWRNQDKFMLPFEIEERERSHAYFQMAAFKAVGGIC
jgi:hypothetical protein